MFNRNHDLNALKTHTNALYEHFLAKRSNHTMKKKVPTQSKLEPFLKGARKHIEINIPKGR